MIRSRLFSAFLTVLLLQGCTKTVSPPSVTLDSKPLSSTTTLSPVAQLLERRLARKTQTERVSLQNALAEMKSASVLYPDRRFVQAFAAVHEQITDEGAQPVAASWRNGKWVLSYKGQEIGELSELSSFDEMYKLLVSWTQRLVEKHHYQLPEHGIQLSLQAPNIGVSDEILAKVSKFTPKNLFEALTLLNSIWNSGEHSADVLTTSAHALARLCWQSFDTMGINDPLSSQALAAVVLGEVVTKSQFAEDKILLADAFGYDATAIKLSKQANPGTFFALWGDNNFAQLQRLALSPKSSAIEQYAYLKALCARRDRPSLKIWLKDFSVPDASYSLSVLNAVQNFGMKEVEMPTALQMLGACNAAAKNASNFQLSAADLEWVDPEERMSRAVGLLGPGLLANFEASLEASSGTAKRGENAIPKFFLTPAMVANYYRAYFFSAIASLTRSTLQLQSSRLLLQRLHECLLFDKGAPSNQLAPWVMAVNSLNSGKANVEDLQKDLIDLDSLHGTALGTLMLLGANLPGGFDLVFSASELFIARVDSRPPFLTTIAQLAERPMMDLGLHNRVSERRLSEKISNSIQSDLVLGKNSGNIDYLLKQLSKDTVTIAEKISILRFAEIQKRSAGDLSKYYEQLIRQSPHSWTVIASYVNMLVHEGKSESAISILRNWIGSNPHSDEASVMLASLLYDNAQYKDSANVLKSLKGCSLPSFLRLLALNAMQAGDFKQAEAWSAEFSRSYPHDIRSLLVAVSIDCKQMQYASVASALARTRLNREDWKVEVGPTILASIRSDAEALQVVKALKAAQIDAPDNLGQIAAAAYHADRADLAFQILNEVACPVELQSDFFTLQYRYLKRARGQAAALAWLSKLVPAEKRSAMAPYAFISGQDELLFDFMSTDHGDQKSNSVWLLRAAATVVDAAKSVMWKKKIVDHFQSEDNLESRIGLYLQGEYPRDRLLSEPLTVRDRTVASFFVAWKELSAPGDFLEDTEWLRLCLFGNQADLSEYQRARAWLRDLTNTLITEPSSFSKSNLAALHVVSPAVRDNWDGQRRYTLTTKR